MVGDDVPNNKENKEKYPTKPFIFNNIFRFAKRMLEALPKHLQILKKIKIKTKNPMERTQFLLLKKTPGGEEHRCRSIISSFVEWVLLFSYTSYGCFFSLFLVVMGKMENDGRTQCKELRSDENRMA